MTHSISRRTFGLMLLAGAVMGVSGCDEFTLGKGRTTIVLIDQSSSIAAEDRSIYETSLDAICADLKLGDRLLVASVGGQSRSEFRPSLDMSVRATGQRLRDESRLRAAAKSLKNTLPSLLSGQNVPSNQTRLVETIAAASQAFGTKPKRGDQLILLTDGVEDSPIIDLDLPKGVNTEEMAEALARAKAQGFLPDLAGVELSIIGAGGTDYAATESFWRAYAQATGAKLIGYGRLAFAAKH
ncbi:MAG: hypothetical protein RL186_1557 [Pseudomonadota bacterium]